MNLARISELTKEAQLEMYKSVIDRQKMCSEFSHYSFLFFIKFIAWVCVALGALVSFVSKIGSTVPTEKETSSNIVVLTKDHLSLILDGSSSLVWVLGVLTSVQIVFCLCRWTQYRRIESRLSNGVVKAEYGAWIFEVLYVIAILVTCYYYNSGVDRFSATL